MESGEDVKAGVEQKDAYFVEGVKALLLPTIALIWPHYLSFPNGPQHTC